MSDEFNSNGQDEYSSSGNYPNHNTEKGNNQNNNPESCTDHDNNTISSNTEGGSQNTYTDYQDGSQGSGNGAGFPQSDEPGGQYQTYSSDTGGNYQNGPEQQADSNAVYTIYPTPEVKEQKKAKKKRKVPGVFKLTAAGLVFGLVAGAAFQGYYLVMDATGHSIVTESSSVKVASVAQSTSSGDTISTSASSSDEVVSDVSDVVDKVMPSIVAISAKVTSTSYDIFGRGVSQDAEASGSGIIIAQNNSKLLIVTNNHVVDGATTVEITFSDKSTATAEIKGSDSNADLAVLSVNMNDLSKDTISAIKVATLGDSDSVKAGDTAIAIGNALGYGQSVTVGVISAVNREVTIENKTMKLLQTDAAINPGNSGGALLNTEGQVIGINSVKYADTDVEGMGYAIPISNAIPMINELMNREEVSESEQGYLGINAQTAQNVTETYSERFNMPVGIYINEVLKSSPAAKAGLEQGDIITGVDDVSVATIDDLVNALSYKKAGEKIELKIQQKQNGEYTEKTLKVTLGKKN